MNAKTESTGYLSPEQLARAATPPCRFAALRTTPEDFDVDEQLGFELTGDGQHVWLRIQKRQCSTEALARVLARAAGVPTRQVGYAGMKDVHAVTRQWFSVDLAGSAEPDWQAHIGTGCELLEVRRHRRKLRRGALCGNAFRIVLREVAAEHSAVEQRLAEMGEAGVPNYFGPQRFGRDGANVGKAAAMLAGRHRVRDKHLRSIYLSTARSLLFNAVLSRRIELGTWSSLVAGDLAMLDGTRSIFSVDTPDAALDARVGALDVHPSGPLWGRGEPRSQARAAEIERSALSQCGFWCESLEAAGLESDRRALRVAVRELDWCWLDAATLQLRFALPAGSYATSVVAELVSV